MAAQLQRVFLVTFVLAWAAIAAAKQPAPPSNTPAKAQEARQPAVTKPDEQGKGSILVMLTLARSLLADAAATHPTSIRPVIDSVHAAIDKSLADDPKEKAVARQMLCTILWDTAPTYGLEEVESLLADPGALTEEQLVLVRLMAGMLYLSADRPEAAEKQFDVIASSASSKPRLLSWMWAYRAMAATSGEEALGEIANAMEFAKKSGAEGPSMMATFSKLRWCKDKAAAKEVGKELVEEARNCKHARLGALISLTALSLVADTGAEKVAFVESVLARIQSVPMSDARERLGDMMFISAAAKGDPALSERISKDAESFARQHFADKSEEVKMARLVHAKALRDSGAKDLTAYADLNLDEELTGSFAFTWSFKDGDPTPEVLATVRKANVK